MSKLGRKRRYHDYKDMNDILYIILQYINVSRVVGFYLRISTILPRILTTFIPTNALSSMIHACNKAMWPICVFIVDVTHKQQDMLRRRRTRRRRRDSLLMTTFL